MQKGELIEKELAQAILKMQSNIDINKPPSRLIVPASALMAARQVLNSTAPKTHEIEVKFDDN